MKKHILHTNDVVLEGAALPLLIILYGVPAVLLILSGILLTLGIRLLMRQYRKRQTMENVQKPDEEDLEEDSDYDEYEEDSDYDGYEEDEEELGEEESE